MPKNSGTTGKRAEYRALEIMKIGKAVTPSEIDAHTGTGAYSSKYMSFLKRDGFTIQVNKDGRTVVSYTLLAKPDDSKLPKGAFDRVKPVKTPKAEKKTKAVVPAKKESKPAKVKVVAVETEKMVLPSKKKVISKVAAKKAPKDVPQEPFANDGEIAGGSFAVDGGWDDLDPRELA